MKNRFFKELLFMACCVIVGHQIKTDSLQGNALIEHRFKIEHEYKQLIDSGKLTPNIYNLMIILLNIQADNKKIYDEVIKYFIAHGCDIHETVDCGTFCEYSVKFANLNGRFVCKTQEEIQKLIKEAEEKIKSDILTKMFTCFKHGIMTYIAGSPENPYLVKALIDNGANINNLGGMMNFFKAVKSYDYLAEGHGCSCDGCDNKKFQKASFDVAKYIYRNNSYINRAIMYLAMSKQMYEKINE